MINNKLTESEVLANLNISDLRQINRNNIQPFLSLVGSIDPEVIKKAFDVVKDFSLIIHDALKDLKETTLKAIDKSSEEAKSFNNNCEIFMSALAKKYSKDNLSSDEEDKIIEDMKWIIKEQQKVLEHTQEITKELAKSHNETGKMILKGITEGLAFCGGALLGGLFGVKFYNTINPPIAK